MTAKDYRLLAQTMGDGLAIAHKYGGEVGRTEVYDKVYTPLVVSLKLENPCFNEPRFAYATAQAEFAYRGVAEGISNV